MTLSRQFKRFATISATFCLAVGGLVFAGPQAQAEQKCGSKHWMGEFDTPGENIDVEYDICVDKSGG